MKKVLSLALVVAMLLSCVFAMSASAATIKAVATVDGDNGTVGELIEVDFYVGGLTDTIYMAQVTVGYDPAVVLPWAAEADSFVTADAAASFEMTEGALAEFATTNRHKNDTYPSTAAFAIKNKTMWGNEGFSANAAAGYIGYYITCAGNGTSNKAYDLQYATLDETKLHIVTFVFKRIAEGNANIGIKPSLEPANPNGAIVELSLTSGAVEFDIVNPTVEEPDNTIVGKAAAGVATTNGISFAGKVRADLLDKDYGVVVNGKKFAGAKVDDKVWDGTGEYGNSTVVMTGEKAWDGSFVINLTNIFDKVEATAITATGNFYVGSETQAYTAVEVTEAN